MQYLKTNPIMFAFYDFIVKKANFQNTAVFQSSFSFSLLPTCLHFVRDFKKMEGTKFSSFRLVSTLELTSHKFVNAHIFVQKRFLLNFFNNVKMLWRKCNPFWRYALRECISQTFTQPTVASGMYFPRIKKT